MSSSIIHIVFFRLPDNAQISAQEVADRLMTMDGQVEQLRSIETGVDFNRSERAWDVSLHTVFDSKDDLQGYQQHPFHLEIVSWLKAHSVGTCVVDYER